MKASTPTLNSNRLKRMVEISRILNSTTNLDDLLTYIIREAADLTDSESASILLLDPHTRELHFKAASDGMAPAMVDTAVPLDSSIAGAVLQSNQPLTIEDVSKDNRWNQSIDQAINFKTRNMLAVPMHDVDRPVGVLEAVNKKVGTFTPEDLETLATLADLAGVAVEKARLIEELQEAYEELNELDQLKTDFIALASHELRTPLAIILGYVSFLRDEASPEMANQLNSVLKAAVRLRSLIQDMLNFQYADVGETRLNLEHIDLVQLVREITKARDDTADAKNQTIAIQLPRYHIPVHVDTGMMEVILTNLISNAVKFTPEDGSIEILVEQRNSEAWLYVKDNGIGIPSDKLERIFKRFYQVEDHMRRRYEGMGLGLAIAKELVELQNGRIWAENQQPAGSIFTVALPLAP